MIWILLLLVGLISAHLITSKFRKEKVHQTYQLQNERRLRTVIPDTSNIAIILPSSAVQLAADLFQSAYLSQRLYFFFIGAPTRRREDPADQVIPAPRITYRADLSDVSDIQFRCKFFLLLSETIRPFQDWDITAVRSLQTAYPHGAQAVTLFPFPFESSSYSNNSTYPATFPVFVNFSGRGNLPVPVFGPRFMPSSSKTATQVAWVSASSFISETDPILTSVIAPRIPFLFTLPAAERDFVLTLVCFAHSLPVLTFDYSAFGIKLLEEKEKEKEKEKNIELLSFLQRHPTELAALMIAAGLDPQEQTAAGHIRMGLSLNYRDRDITEKYGSLANFLAIKHKLCHD